MLSVMTDNLKERSQLSSFLVLGALCGAMGSGIATPALVAVDKLSFHNDESVYWCINGNYFIYIIKNIDLFAKGSWGVQVFGN